MDEQIMKITYFVLNMYVGVLYVFLQNNRR